MKEIRNKINHLIPERSINIVFYIVLNAMILSIGLLIFFDLNKPTSTLFDPYQSTNYSYLNIDTMSDVMMTRGIEEFYLVHDGENYFLIQNYSEPSGQMLACLEYSYGHLDEPVDFQVKGMPMTISEDMYEIVAQTFNEWFETDIYDAVNISDFIGFNYLDLNASPYGDIYDTILVIDALILLPLFIAFGLAKLWSYLKTKNEIVNTLVLNNSQDFLEELNNPVDVYPKARLLILKNYIIGNGARCHIVSDNDIIWAYVRKRKACFVITMEVSLIVMTKDFKKHTLMSVLPSQEVYNAINESYHYMSSNNPNILVGYTKEHIKEISMRKKSLK